MERAEIVALAGWDGACGRATGAKVASIFKCTIMNEMQQRLRIEDSNP
jgi:hypothetical protein